MRKTQKYPNHKVFTRLGVSKIHGVGVFAIVNIPKGTYVFENDKSKMKWYDAEELNLSQLPEKIQQLYNDFCIILTKNNKKKYGCPDSFNNMTSAWYLNEPVNGIPNMACDKKYDFYAIRDIKVGEELTINYQDYSE